jgi:hypothetical protein
MVTTLIAKITAELTSFNLISMMLHTWIGDSDVVASEHNLSY